MGRTGARDALPPGGRLTRSRPRAVLRRHSGIEPTLEQIDLLGRPRSIAGHRTIPQPREDLVGMCADVVIRPKIKSECHRILISLPKERADVAFEARALGKIHGYSLTYAFLAAS